MHIQSCQIRNYKSFLDSQEIRLTSGFNVVVGQNNAGKTAFLEALSLRYQSKPHRSLQTRPAQASAVALTIKTTPEEIFECFSSVGTVHVPVRSGEHPGGALHRFNTYLNAGPEVHVDTLPGPQATAKLSGLDPLESPNVLPAEPSKQHPLQAISSQGRPEPLGKLAQAVHTRFSSRVYAFRAERLNVSKCRVGLSDILAPDASNLPEVLLLLQSRNKARFERLVRDVSAVFPGVTDITVEPVQGDMAEISVWSVPRESERQDLAVPLADCGTGLSQVLALLYVLVTAPTPRIILIDEPQSFLHPSAIRKLFDILKRQANQNHQFIIATHSPVVITSAAPCTVVLLRCRDGETQAQAMALDAAGDLSILLSELGARLSDVFGADRILWVEGKTEELCFPRIITSVGQIELQGTQIIGLTQVGDLQGRHNDLVFEIYRKLSTRGALLPPALAFCLDQDGRSARQQQELSQASNGLARFIPRRMFENYLLNPEAIAAVLNEADSTRPSPVKASDVEVAIASLRQRPTYAEAQVSGEWATQVHAAALLSDVFSGLSEERVSYSKIKHGTKITEWLLQHSPSDFDELVAFLAPILQSK